MGTFLTDKCNEIRAWLAIGEDVYPNDVITGWIRMAEEYLSNGLRVKHMIQIDTSTLSEGRARLPLDWQEIRLVRTLPDGGVLRYNTADDFYNPEFQVVPTPPYAGRERRYTILGNYVITNSDNTSQEIELTYYQDIPPLTNDADNWPNHYHPTCYTLKILHVAS